MRKTPPNLPFVRGGVRKAALVRVRIFTLPFSDELGGFDDNPLREFLLAKDVSSVRERFLRKDGRPSWTALVTYRARVGAQQKGAEAASGKEKAVKERMGAPLETRSGLVRFWSKVAIDSFAGYSQLTAAKELTHNRAYCGPESHPLRQCSRFVDLL